MRASIFLAGGLMIALAAPAAAGPAYTSNSIVDFFVKAKQSKEATRKICFEGDPDCGPKAAAPKHFDLMVNFEFDSDRLTSEAKENLGQFAQALHDPHLMDQKFAIDGFTDATGTERYNLSLSQRRADAVVGFLTQHGVKRENLVATGYGPTKPRIPADPFSPLNRRVETHLPE